MGAVAETVATNGVSPTFREQSPEEFQELISMLAASDPRGYAAQCRALVDLDLSSELGQITAPVMLLSGDRDGPSPPAVTEANAARIPDLPLHDRRGLRAHPHVGTAAGSGRDRLAASSRLPAKLRPAARRWCSEHRGAHVGDVVDHRLACRDLVVDDLVLRAPIGGCVAVEA